MSGSNRQARASRQAQWWVFVGLFVVVVGGVAPWLARMPNGSETILSILVLTVCCAGIAHSLRAPFRPMLCVFFTFNLCWLGIASVYQLSHGVAAWGDPGITHDTTDVISAQILDLLAVSSFLAGYLFKGVGGQRARRGSTRPARRIAEPRAEIVIDTGRRLRYAAGLLLVSLALFPVVVATTGGIGTLFSSRGGLNNALVAAGVGTSAGGGSVALVKIIPGTAALVACLLVISVLRVDGIGYAGRRGRWIILGVGLLLIVCFANPLANTRYIFINAFGSLALLAFAPRRKRAGYVVLALAVFGLLVAYPLANVFRQGINNSTGVSYSSSQELASDDFDGFQQIVNSEIFVRDQGHSFGHYTESAVFVFVPRSIWHSKATPASIDVASNRNYSFTNLSLPIQAELFIEFGLGGMAVVMFVFGWLWARLDTAWARGGHWEIVVAYLTLAQIGLIRGPLGSLSPVYGLATVLLLISIGLPRPARQPARARARVRSTSGRRAMRARTPQRARLSGG
jgi:oligosaccharide repeat unit polymerase